jgi:hypothetical protein
VSFPDEAFERRRDAAKNRPGDAAFEGKSDF